MLWPSPVRPELKFTMGVSTLDLPVRLIEKPAAPFSVEEIAREPAPFTPYQPATAGPDGRASVAANSPPEPYVVAGIGTELSSGSQETCDIRPDDPVSSRWRQSVSSSWKRDTWNCRVEASYELVSDANYFRVTESLRAFLDGKEVFDLKNEARIPRDLM
jgi:hypothetical protein